MTKQRLIQLIHIARNDLQMDEDTYRQMLQGLTGKASTKGMDVTQLNRVMESMKKKGFRIKPAGKSRPDLPLDTHPQSKKLRALWLELASAGIVRDSSEQALALWVKRETGISALRWLSNEQASSVIEKLKKWQRRAAGGKQ
ncbi:MULTISPECIES: gp16 family protein [unclassified Enterobacter]|uniref:gp16 family protein n=1 Tax=unclassified Enterobacter TaxID=2608935 RepID=UPI002147E2C3|nr:MULTISPECIES: regulatory protein GemA [unclassified Enterobacter]MCR1304496.1 regulatory protein GemA [Enterobacter sp. FL1277]MCR1309484.1 regulatory protein GemA [Enterobacter sp. BT1271]MCR1311609.1 regulatory protein GemA [Enterobacter sp. BT855]MCR1321791.1 regulatory protein GemA [Enterobacter sp. BT1268]MCR1327047.1 regulatory protein GemA [Enterobacter sp. BT1131]